MNCCNPMTGKCTQGDNCPVRETPQDKAVRHFWEPNQALHIEAYTGPTRLQRVLDWLGNTADKIRKWWGRLNELQLVGVAVIGVSLCFAVAVAAVG